MRKRRFQHGSLHKQEIQKKDSYFYKEAYNNNRWELAVEIYVICLINTKLQLG